MFRSVSAFNHDNSSWNGTAATTTQADMFFGATAFQAKYTCTDLITGPASSCDTIKSDWVAPSPPPSPPNESWHTFVAECLLEAPETGECTTWASENTHGTMPNWDTSLVEDMSGYDSTTTSFKGFGNKDHFNGDISNWDTSSVTNMYKIF
ncbi:unnamed protein product [Bathycoccus prasinos]